MFQNLRACFNREGFARHERARNTESLPLEVALSTQIAVGNKELVLAAAASMLKH
jgi:hypothetical protein